jgi:hypothetical protein
VPLRPRTAVVAGAPRRTSPRPAAVEAGEATAAEVVEAAVTAAEAEAAVTPAAAAEATAAITRFEFLPLGPGDHGGLRAHFFFGGAAVSPPNLLPMN